MQLPWLLVLRLVRVLMRIHNVLLLLLLRLCLLLLLQSVFLNDTMDVIPTMTAAAAVLREVVVAWTLIVPMSIHTRSSSNSRSHFNIIHPCSCTSWLASVEFIVLFQGKEEFCDKHCQEWFAFFHLFWQEPIAPCVGELDFTQFSYENACMSESILPRFDLVSLFHMSFIYLSAILI